MIGNKWDIVLSKYLESDKFLKFYDSIINLYNTEVIFPLKKDVFRAFKLTDFDDVRVVILGQDPYHGVGEANGLSFSVNEGVRIPPSLKNIFKEIKRDLDVDVNNNGDLSNWARQGVLLLNSVLTVKKDTPASHRNIGWESFTDYVIKTLSDECNNIVFILWGNYAREKKHLIDSDRHLVLESVHPSPFSARNGFFGSSHFSLTNNYLIENKKEPIDWSI